MAKQFIKFLIYGAFSAVVYFGIYIYLSILILPIIATIVAFIVSVIVSYLLNSFFVFTTTKGSFKIFMLIALSGLFWNMIIIFIFTELIIKNSTFAGILVLITIPMHNFLLNYKLNFK